jgi:putative chitinase
MITAKHLREIMPNCPASTAEQYVSLLSAAMIEGGITTVTRAAAFLGQLAHESGDLRYMEEIASGEKYEGRADLGNIEHGDGPRYKGRGPIQLTGRENYSRYGTALGVPLVQHPELAADPEIGFRIAVKYWVDHRLNERADRLDWIGITRAINGGVNGYDIRLLKTQVALAVLGREVEIFP